MNPIIALSVFLIGTGLIIPPYEQEFDLWDKTCQMVQDVYPCDGIKKPQIKDLSLEDAEKYNERFFGDDIIYIDPALTGAELAQAVFHGYIHYLQYTVGELRLPANIMQFCWAEEQASVFTDVFIKEVLHAADLIRGKAWWKLYPDCYVFYQPRIILQE